MTETTMPAAEAAELYTDEVQSYEFAFHVLPTVAEGEVAGVYEAIKAHITRVGGAIFDEEVPERIDLAYPVVKHLEGKNRKFASAYFGWIRFRLEGEKLAALMEELDADGTILRSLLIKLTKREEAHPYRFHENRKSLKMVETVDEETDVLGETKTETEEAVEVSDAALEESLEKITGEEDESASKV
jgi:ribosomal protein S6